MAINIENNIIVPEKNFDKYHISQVRIVSPLGGDPVGHATLIPYNSKDKTFADDLSIGMDIPKECVQAIIAIVEKYLVSGSGS